ncbi:hypothetical protein BJ508DRAFT_329133 [Ascobolus immersus RN42]|uniref:Uncharacterized protein n=1 Tax=Ascobolus immersus RN42 TaxID=1160509 RepID=A0A3N4HZ81_ASCIM|nr:hypothetical protein BJ508DRAFT_329133 [Ascobolus immersus RN42]
METTSVCDDPEALVVQYKIGYHEHALTQTVCVTLFATPMEIVAKLEKQIARVFMFENENWVGDTMWTLELFGVREGMREAFERANDNANESIGKAFGNRIKGCYILGGSLVFTDRSPFTAALLTYWTSSPPLSSPVSPAVPAQDEIYHLCIRLEEPDLSCTFHLDPTKAPNQSRTVKDGELYNVMETRLLEGLRGKLFTRLRYQGVQFEPEYHCTQLQFFQRSDQPGLSFVTATAMPLEKEAEPLVEWRINAITSAWNTLGTVRGLLTQQGEKAADTKDSTFDTSDVIAAAGPANIDESTDATSFAAQAAKGKQVVKTCDESLTSSVVKETKKETVIKSGRTSPERAHIHNRTWQEVTRKNRRPKARFRKGVPAIERRQNENRVSLPRHRPPPSPALDIPSDSMKEITIALNRQYVSTMPEPPEQPEWYIEDRRAKHEAVTEAVQKILDHHETQLSTLNSRVSSLEDMNWTLQKTVHALHNRRLVELARSHIAAKHHCHDYQDLLAKKGKGNDDKLLEFLISQHGQAKNGTKVCHVTLHGMKPVEFVTFLVKDCKKIVDDGNHVAHHASSIELRDAISTLVDGESVTQAKLHCTLRFVEDAEKLAARKAKEEHEA